MMLKLKKRTAYCIIFILLVMTEVVIALFVKDKFIRPYVGDILAVMVVYCFIRIFIPDKLPLLPLYVFIFAVGVEAMQLLAFIQNIAKRNRILGIITGSTFDLKDILCYCIGCVMLYAIEFYKNRGRAGN